jgi:ubiquitin-activating enzyme E1
MTAPDPRFASSDRQLAVVGIEAMKLIVSSSVLISGLGGLGAEIAKNLLLAGIGRLVLHDCKPVQVTDLASNFCLGSTSIGENRAAASLLRLAKLNESASLSALTDPLALDILTQFSCIVFTEPHKESELDEITGFCHVRSIPIVLCESHGVFGYLFNDFGDSFTVREPNSDEARPFEIGFVTRSEAALVSV